MVVLKLTIYVMTFAAISYFQLRENKLKHQLTDDLLNHEHETASDFDSFYELRRNIKRERLLRSLPAHERSKLRVVMSLKVLFAAALVIEVLVLQR